MNNRIMMISIIKNNKNMRRIEEENHRLRSEIKFLKSILFKCKTGIEWWCDAHPNSASSADGEMIEEIEEAINNEQ